MVNEKKLRELILEKGFKLKYIAEKLDLSPMGFRLKLTNKNDFTVNEAYKIAEILNIRGYPLESEIFLPILDT